MPILNENGSIRTYICENCSQEIEAGPESSKYHDSICKKDCASIDLKGRRYFLKTQQLQHEELEKWDALSEEEQKVYPKSIILYKALLNRANPNKNQKYGTIT